MGAEAWIESVVRYQQLLHMVPTPAIGAELARLRHELRGEEFDRRDFRRYAASLDARLRNDEYEAPCRVFDVGAGGFGLINESHLVTREGQMLTLVVEIMEGSERIDFPVRVSRVDSERKQLGVSIAGPPLRMRRPRRIPVAFEELLRRAA